MTAIIRKTAERLASSMRRVNKTAELLRSSRASLSQRQGLKYQTVVSAKAHKVEDSPEDRWQIRQF